MTTATAEQDDGWATTVGTLPAGHQARAERVRSHLVMVRGGAPFLSPADGALLVSWLDAQIPVAAILAAIESAADRRRKRRSHLPLALAHAAGDLTRQQRRGPPQPSAAPGDEPAAWLAHDQPDHPLAGLAMTLHGGPYAHLRDELLALDPSHREELAERAILLAAAAHEQRWRSLPDDERASLLDAARAALGDVADLLDEGTLEEVLAEHARGLLRERTPALSATAILQAVAP